MGFGCVVAIGLIAVQTALAAAPASQAPYAAWKTIATAHYRIHYPPVLEAWAQDVAGHIEAIHARVTALVGYVSPGPVQVVLCDPMAESNGLAVPLVSLPYVVLWRTEPPSDSPIGGTMSSWTEELLAHELTHIHHLTRPARAPRSPLATDSLFSLPLGPLLLKSPRWVNEGYATLLEGRVTGYGRPHSALRAAVLRQWAGAGKLPPYRELNGGQGYLGASMAYLVGSAYLEWLERQRPDRPDILRDLWKQLAARRGGFEPAFTATFGFTAQDGYQRFQAEASHDALEWEARVRAQGVREGALWLRVPGGIADLGVSPDGSRLLARLETRQDPGLRVWDLEPGPPPAVRPPSTDGFNAVADAPPEFPAPALRASLPSLDRQEPRSAQWLDDRTVLFQLPRADGEGTLQLRPVLWRVSGGGEDNPGGLAFCPAPLRPAGSILVPVRRPGRWELVMAGQTVPLPGQPAGRAWIDAPRGLIFAGCEQDGTWNLVRVPYRSEDGSVRFGSAEVLTRSASAAWNPAPTPDGRWLFYTSLDARGMEIRKLDLALVPLSQLGQLPAPEPRLLAPGVVTAAPLAFGALPAPVLPPAATPYRALDNLWTRLAAGVSLTPSGTSVQLGASGSDLLGRLSWLALAGLGDGPGPRGAMLGLASAAWPWQPSGALFSALERPSLQGTAPVPADRERRGGELALTRQYLGDTRWWLSPVAAWERVQPLPGAGYDRGLAGLRGGLQFLRARGPWGVELSPGLQGYAGRSLTPGSQGWTALRAELTVRLDTPALPLTLKGEQGSFRGNPNEAFHLGGVTTSLVPRSLDLDRVEQPALPAGTATGDRFLRWRGELGGKLRLYGEGTALWNAGQDRGAFQRVLGLEWAMNGPQLGAPDQSARRTQLRLGLHRPLDGAMKGRTMGTLTLTLRP